MNRAHRVRTTRSSGLRGPIATGSEKRPASISRRLEIFLWVARRVDSVEDSRGVQQRSSILLLDEQRVVSDRVESELLQRYVVNRLSLAESSATAAVDLVLVSCSSARQVRLPELPPGVPCVLVAAGQPALADVVAAIHAGASDLVASSDVRSIVSAIEVALERRRLERELIRLADAPAAPDVAPQILGESQVMVKLRARIARIAASDIAVLVTGPAGSGKDLVARALHDAGPRRGGPFVMVECGALPQDIGAAERELFGHGRGTFAGGEEARVGLLAQANGGTLLLDDVEELPLELQARLLRALQERCLRPAGQGTQVPFDARVVAMSSSDIELEVAAGRLREDLYFRLNAVSVRVPALAERGHDILLLAQCFIRRASTETRPLLGLTPGAARALMAYDWPGNVSELERCIVSAATTAPNDHVGTADLPAPVGQPKPALSPESLKSLEVVERAHILSTLSAVDGNRALASRILKLDRKTLYRKLKSYAGSEPPPRPRMDSAPG